MPLSKQQKDDIKNLLLFQIRKKLKTYKPETTSMPFHTRLLGKDRMALFSFIHSFNTTLGTSIFEQVAKIIGQSHFPRIVSQYSIGNQISSSAQNTIQEIMNKLTTSELLPDKEKETNKVLKDAGFRVSKTVVVAVEVPDQPGGLHSIMEALTQDAINVEYLYAFVEKSGQNAVIIFRFDNPEKAIDVLTKKNFTVIPGSKLYEF